MQISLTALVVTLISTGVLLVLQGATALDPSPDLSPNEVVRIQVEALQQNDAPVPDAGIATVFRFASPSNRAATGPLDRFTRMVKGPVYGDMLNAAHAAYAPIAIDGDRAAQRVTLSHADGRRAAYVFRLSRQDDGPCEGCWMTDGVEREAPRPNGVTRI